MLDSIEGKVGRKSTTLMLIPALGKVGICSIGLWDVCPGSFAASREPGQPWIVGLLPGPASVPCCSLTRGMEEKPKCCLGVGLWQ